MWTITFGICKHETDAERFLTSDKNRYACPACGSVWRIEQQGKHVVTPSGFVIPPRKVCVVEAQLMLVVR